MLATSCCFRLASEKQMNREGAGSVNGLSVYIYHSLLLPSQRSNSRTDFYSSFLHPCLWHPFFLTFSTSFTCN